MQTTTILIIVGIVIMLFGVTFYVSNIVLTNQQKEIDAKVAYEVWNTEFTHNEKLKIKQMELQN